jgi:hypothetical protein
LLIELPALRERVSISNQRSAINNFRIPENPRSLHYVVAGAPASVGMTIPWAGEGYGKREKGDLWLEIAFLQ